jgi:hypothetical protein
MHRLSRKFQLPHTGQNANGRGGSGPLWVKLGPQARRCAGHFRSTPINGHRRIDPASPFRAKNGSQMRAIAATGPPPGGPWCSAPPETYTALVPARPLTNPPTAARAWRVALISVSSSMV